MPYWTGWKNIMSDMDDLILREYDETPVECDICGNDEMFSDHPNGRCTPVPLTKSWAELGIPGMAEQPPIQSGQSQFLMLPADQQRRIMGDASYRAWKAGAVSLEDFVGVKTSSQWGETHYKRSLNEILGPGAEQFKTPPIQPARQAA